jgi:lysozyme family protein
VLQRVLGVADDGVIGPLTIAAAMRCDARSTVTKICDERLAFLRSLRTWRVFGKGWGRRVAEVKAAALVMISKDG